MEKVIENSKTKTEDTDRKLSPVGQPKFDISRNYFSSFIEQQSKIIKELDSINISDISTQIANATRGLDFQQLSGIITKITEQPIIPASEFVTLSLPSIYKNIPSINIPQSLFHSLSTVQRLTRNYLSNNPQINYDVQAARFTNPSWDGNTIKVNDLNKACSASSVLNKIGSSENTSFSAIELTNFMSEIRENPSFAFNTKTGKKIYKLIQSIPVITLSEHFYYHARKRGIDECPYTVQNMRQVPIDFSQMGRYNHANQVAFYFSNSPENATHEIRKHMNKNTETINVVKIKPSCGIKIIDLSKETKIGKTLFSFIRYAVRDNAPSPREYLIPNFIADCCRALDIEGIKYSDGKDVVSYVCWKDSKFEFCEMVV